jgi:hypothetical protein
VQRVRPNLGIPQGGIDSPYLFNIYLHELDKFVNTEITDYINSLNQKADIPKNRPGRALKSRHALYSRVLRRLGKISRTKRTLKRFKKSSAYVPGLLGSLYRDIKEIRLMNHKLRNIEYTDSTKRRLRLFYTRYADDWIILGNFDKQIAEKIKNKIKDFLLSELKATLSEKKTVITDITKSPAHFLGFEITRYPRGRLLFSNGKLTRASGMIILTNPDRQRLINRLHMKGYCDRKGLRSGLVSQLGALCYRRKI